MTVAIIDLDPVVYSCASVGEERYIEVEHLPSGRITEFANKTTFWGRRRDRSEGWLGDLNKERVEKGLTPFSPKEFNIVEKQRVKEDVRNVFHSAKLTIHGYLDAVKANSYMGFVDSGKPSFRVERSTLIEYKGNRKDTLKPLLRDDVKDYLIKHQNAVASPDHIESDDMVVIEALKYGKGEAVVVSIDKDILGNPVLSYNPNKPELGIQDGDQFGNLFLDAKGKVRGIGRLFKYWQIITQDDTDNYKANCHSDVKWGEKSGYNALKDVQNDKDAWKVMYDTFNLLYPEPKIITSWKGDEIEIDSLYCFQELFDLVHMLRHPKDRVDVADVLKKYKII